MLRWPTSELPICPCGRPTANSDASIDVCGHVATSRSQLRLPRARDGVVRRRFAAAEAVEDDEHDGASSAGRTAAGIGEWGSGRRDPASGHAYAIILPSPQSRDRRFHVVHSRPTGTAPRAHVVSGAMLVWPIVQRRLSPVRDIGNLEATRLINSANALLVDVRETKEFEGGRLPKAVHIPLSQLDSRGDELARHAGRPVVAYCMTRQPQQRWPPRRWRASDSRTSTAARRLPGMEGRWAAGREMTVPRSRCTRRRCARTASRRSAT